MRHIYRKHQTFYQTSSFIRFKFDVKKLIYNFRKSSIFIKILEVIPLEAALMVIVQKIYFKIYRYANMLASHPMHEHQIGPNWQ